MKMIVGLGNPGTKYQETKHNIGFTAVDEIARHYKVVFNRSKFEADIAEFFIGTEKIMLVKPLTFMNESGRSVGALMTYYGISEEELIIIYDDMDLPAGKIRLREKGGAGGHNGIKSLIAHLGTKAFPRIKVGIGRPLLHHTVIHHVLSPFSKEAQEDMKLAIKTTVAAVIYTCEGENFVDTMNQFNGK